MTSTGASKEDTQYYWTNARSFIAGYGSGIGLVLAGHPFDTIKVRMATEGVSGKFGGPIDCLRTTITQEGPLAVYKGVAAPLFLTGLINAVLFGTQKFVSQQIADASSGLAGSTTPTSLQTAQSAIVSGAFISVLVAPMEGVKARLQVQYNSGAPAKYSGPIDCAKQVYRQLGLRNGIYRGWVPTAFCRMSNWAYFGSYAVIRQALTPARDPSLPAGTLQPTLSVGRQILAGGSSGICYWLSCYPMDVIKNRMQAAPDIHPPLYNSTRHAFQVVWRKEGFKGLFAGFSPCVLRAFPANAAAFGCYELVMRFLPERL